MIDAFKQIGLTVDVVSGDSDTRKRVIRHLKSNISNGVQYDFLYMESSTLPLFMTEKHLRLLYKNPFLDFGFLMFCKRAHLPIGLFYRDIYWRFKVGRQAMKVPRRWIAVILYIAELYMFSRLAHVLYLPNANMRQYLPFRFRRVDALPPGARPDVLAGERNDDGILRICYVGGLGPYYRMQDLFRAVAAVENTRLTVCCRKPEWDDVSHDYFDCLSSRVKIVHESGAGLEFYLRQADIFSCVFEPNEYRQFAMPVKLFEYLSYEKPIIVTANTAAGEFICRNEIGWCVDYTVDSIARCLRQIQTSPNEYKVKAERVGAILPANTWRVRAAKVVDDLASSKAGVA